MPGLLETCRDLFKTDNLYEVLGVQKSSADKDVKKGYHKVSLKVHPDRVSPKEKEIATQKFQTLGKVYSILSDKEKRKVYDDTGEIDDENDIPQDRDWYDFWRLLFKKISVDDIKTFEQDYQDSAEELEDLKNTYVKFEGKMDDILENIMCATIEDEGRFTDILKDLIKKKEIPDFPAFSKESKTKKMARKRKYKKEAAEAEDETKKMEENGMNSLQALIQQRQQSREQKIDSFFSDLEAKYAKPKSKTKGSKKTKK